MMNTTIRTAMEAGWENAANNYVAGRAIRVAESCGWAAKCYDDEVIFSRKGTYLSVEVNEKDTFGSFVGRCYRAFCEHENPRVMDLLDALEVA